MASRHIHLGLMSIQDEAFWTLLYLNQEMWMALGSIDHQEVGPSTTQDVPHHEPINKLPREVRGYGRGGRCRKQATGLREDECP